MDRPRQMVSREYGKRAITSYRVLERKDGRTRVTFYPHTGRTHQLRVHAAHPEGRSTIEVATTYTASRLTVCICTPPRWSSYIR